MKKGFVYPAGGASYRGVVLPKKEAEKAQLQFERISSPRKRKRSPESLPGPSGLNRFPDKRPSIPAEQQADYEVDDYLDELGTAALEQYELTQRSPRAVGTHRLSPTKRTTTNWLTTETRLPTATKPVLVSSDAAHVRHKQVVPEQKDAGVWEGKREKQNVVSYGGKKYEECVAKAGGREVNSEMEQLCSELDKKDGELRELEEKGYERDGEVKLLRSELRKKDDQLRDLHSRIMSEQKVKDEQFVRETKSLSTQLEFKEQELAALRERCSVLEQRHKQQPSVAHTSPIPHSRPPLKNTPGEGGTRGSRKDSVFLSTETFMPLSQMSSSDVTPVHVAHAPKKGTPKQVCGGKSMSPETLDVKHGAHVASQHSQTQSPLLVAARAKSVERHHPVTESRDTPKSQKTSHLSTPASVGKAASSSSSTMYDEPIHLSVPPLEVSGRDLLMLLAHRDLLKVPSFEDTENESSDDEVECSDAQTPLQSANSSLPGLFSLLHIPHSRSSSLSSPVLGSMTTPVSNSKFHSMTPPSGGTNTSIPSLDLSPDSLPQTPIRKSRPQVYNKSHTCARTDMMRSRTRVALDDFPLRKTLSASNTPIHRTTAEPDSETQVSSSLVSSIDVDSLKGSILSLLRDESSTVSSLLRSNPTLFSTTQSSRVDSPSVEIQLLLDLGDVVQCYVTEQLERARASVMSGASNSSHLSDLDSLDTQSPRSSVGSSSASSRNSADLNQPPKADQSLVCQSLSLLEILLTYSQKAREQLAAPPPPEFAFEDEASTTALETKLEKVQRVREKDEGDRMEEEEIGDSEDVNVDEMKTPTMSRAVKPRTVTWKGTELEQLGTGQLSKVWVPRAEQPQSLPAQAASWRRRSGSVPLSITPYGRGVGDGGERGRGEGVRSRWRDSGNVGRRGRQLLSSLLRLVSPHWKESNEVILLCLKLLCILAQDCPQEQLERFSSLLDQDGLDVYLEEAADPGICLTSLSLLTSLVNSPQLTSRLCSQGVTSEGCLLQICYDYFTRSVTEEAVMTLRIRQQVIRLVSSIAMVPGGPAILFESSCGCCEELLKSVVSLMQLLVQDVYSSEDLPQSSTVLLCLLIALLHKISVSDRYFDSHREACKFSFVFSLHSLKLLFKDNHAVNSTTKYILSELYLEFCEEADDSTDSSCEDGETQMAN